MKNPNTLKAIGPDAEYANMSPDDVLTEILRTGAVRLLVEAVETEVAEFIEQ